MTDKKRNNVNEGAAIPLGDFKLGTLASRAAVRALIQKRQKKMIKIRWLSNVPNAPTENLPFVIDPRTGMKLYEEIIFLEPPQ